MRKIVSGLFISFDGVVENPADWRNSTLLRGDDLAATLGEIKAGPGGDIAVPGSISLVRSLLALGLLDELKLMVHPIVVGKGVTLFDGSTGPVPLALQGSETFGSGVVYSTYTPA